MAGNTDSTDERATRPAARRSVLLALAGAGVAGLAGCGADGGDGDETTVPPADGTTSGTAGTGTPTPDATRTPSATAAGTTTGPTTATTTAGTTAAPVGGRSAIGPGDGFTTAGLWLSTTDASINRVREPTREALEAAIAGDGPRVVVFETSGTIDLGWEPIEIRDDRCWVAGQTAPSPGVTLTKGTLVVAANDCVVQHLRIRRGERSGAGEGKDAITTGDDTRDNVVDHVSAYWGRDENCSVGYRSTDTTVSNCLIAEGLSEPAENSNGSLIGDDAAGVALLGNCYAHCLDRNPRLKDGTRSVVANTLGYQFNEACNMSGGATTSFVGNAYLRPMDPGDSIVDHDGEAYVEDCFVADPPLDDGTPLVSDVPTQLDEKPLWPRRFAAMPAADVEAHNTRHAGARPADRDAHDERVIAQIRSRSGEIIGAQGDVGGHLALAENSHELDVPDSGLREYLDGWAAAVEDPAAAPPG